MKRWTRVEEGHARKYLISPGRFLHGLDGAPTEGEIGFWGEWEALSEVVPVSNPLRDGPRWMHRPFWSHQVSYRGLQNTDPFVFGDHFRYTGCLQHTKHGATQLRNLSRGTVILFGSKRAGRPEFTTDTVFVVASHVDHSLRDYKRRLRNVVSETYEAVTLGPWYGNMDGCTPQDADRSYRLYLGATVDDPVEGMFSFFPCVTGDRKYQGFARPTIRIPGVVTPTMTQNYRLNPQQSIGEIKPLWIEATRQVTNQGLALGTFAELPHLQNS
ncbi:MAG: hypothetical protein ACRDJC_05890 [Thermomicrobiales bacterium]